MKLQVMNRVQVEMLSAKKFKPHTMLISISDYDDSGAKITHFPEFFTKMSFDDVDATERDYHALDTYQAKRFAQFYFQCKDRAQIIICQCEHGESRSTAVAAAIAEYENKDGLKYFIDDKYCPNKFVFHKIYTALHKEGTRLRRKKNTFVAIDIETTGLGKSAEIIEIGAIKCECGDIVDRFQTFVACSAPIPEAITAITNISDSDLIGAPDINIALSKLKDFIGDLPIIGYNVGFDMVFIKRYGEENGITFENKAIDVLALAREKLHDKSGVENYRLSTIAKYFDIDFVPHRANNDAEATVEIYNRLRDI